MSPDPIATSNRTKLKSHQSCPFHIEPSLVGFKGWDSQIAISHSHKLNNFPRFVFKQIAETELPEHLQEVPLLHDVGSTLDCANQRPTPKDPKVRNV